ncbi:MAG: lipid-A-disaccharide synthase [Verrucomicrobia bacterium]|nr:lipid-A-disaccharide synthase [Verrucomicrobiota bacterium]
MSSSLFVIAGEKSGDLHGEKLLLALRNQNPTIEIMGVGGPKMRSVGMECILPMEEFQVMGFVDVFFALPKLYRQFHQVARAILERNPQAVLTIDYPGFNLRLVRYLKKKGYKGKCIHYICPSVWAWGKKRIPLMERVLDQLLTILPFEKTLFSSKRLQVTYVGHPLVQRLKTHTYQTLPLSGKILALFPGSRKKEIERNLPLYLKICKQIQRENPDLQIALSVSDEKLRPLILSLIQDAPITLIPGELTYELMKAAHMAIAKSGTVTLELALHGTPTVITYAISPVDLFIARDILRIRLPYYALPNLIAQKEIFTELFGPNFTEERLYQAVKDLLEPTKHSACITRCKELQTILGEQDAATSCAQSISLY